jgi:hypothetical protein
LNDDSIPIDERAYRVFERARVLCTRGYGKPITQVESDFAIQSLREIGEWMAEITKKVGDNERLQQQDCSTTRDASADKRATLA